MEEKKYRIGNVALVVLGFFSILADLITLIPLAGDIVGPIFWFCAGIYFWKAGLGLLNWKKLVPGLISLGGEFVPAIQEFPTIVAAVIVIIAVSRVEDKTGFKILPSKGKPGLTPPRKRAPPSNQGGIRLARQRGNIQPQMNSPQPKVDEEISLAE